MSFILQFLFLSSLPLRKCTNKSSELYCHQHSNDISKHIFLLTCEISTVRYARRNVIGSRNSFVIASVRSSIHWNICI